MAGRAAELDAQRREPHAPHVEIVLAREAERARELVRLAVHEARSVRGIAGGRGTGLRAVLVMRGLLGEIACAIELHA